MFNLFCINIFHYAWKFNWIVKTKNNQIILVFNDDHGNFSNEQSAKINVCKRMKGQTKYYNLKYIYANYFFIN